MKGYYRHILLASAAILAAASCTKTHVEEIPSEPMPISISAAEGTPTKALLDNGTFNPTPETKALLDENTFQTSGNRIQIYDFVTSGGATTMHVDDLIGPELNSNSPLHTPGYTWPFVNGPHQWCPGEHKFFGWLAQDAKMTASNTPETFFGGGFDFDEATHVLTIPQVTFTKDTPQFDFMYSDIFITEPINTPVPLEFKHLFSAFYITALNRDEANTVKINEITLHGLDNEKSAMIDFGGTEPIVSYTPSGNSTQFAFTFSGEELGTTPKSLTGTFLIWPQSADDFADAVLTIKYDYTSEGQTEPQTKPIPLTSMTEWTAGVVNSINLVFDLEQITFYIRTLEQWNTEEKDIIVEM